MIYRRIAAEQYRIKDFHLTGLIIRRQCVYQTLMVQHMAYAVAAGGKLAQLSAVNRNVSVPQKARVVTIYADVYADV
jgi:hypothetical protein